MPDNASGSLTYSETCDYNDGDLTCSTGVYEGGSTTYHTSGVSVSGDATSGYDVSYSIVDSERFSVLENASEPRWGSLFLLIRAIACKFYDNDNFILAPHPVPLPTGRGNVWMRLRGRATRRFRPWHNHAWLPRSAWEPLAPLPGKQGANRPAPLLPRREKDGMRGWNRQKP